MLCFIINYHVRVSSELCADVACKWLGSSETATHMLFLGDDTELFYFYSSFFYTHKR